MTFLRKNWFGLAVLGALAYLAWRFWPRSAARAAAGGATGLYGPDAYEGPEVNPSTGDRTRSTARTPPGDETITSATPGPSAGDDSQRALDELTLRMSMG